MSHHQLDAKRMLCPMPVIKTQNLVKTLQVGDTLEITCTDPGVVNDIPAWCRIIGHLFLNHCTYCDDIIVNVEVVDG